jgi:hypothetical protein
MIRFPDGDGFARLHFTEFDLFILNPAFAASAPRSCAREPLDTLGALSLSKRLGASASTAEFRFIAPEAARNLLLP